MSKITIDRSVVEQALEALFMYKPMVTGVTFQHGLDAMQALRAALDHPQVEQERCHLCDCTGDIHGLDGEWRGECPYCRPQPPRQPLTEMEIVNLRQLTPGTLDVQFVKFARAIEAAHGIKEQK